jgi:hypothetical protein
VHERLSNPFSIISNLPLAVLDDLPLDANIPQSKCAYLPSQVHHPNSKPCHLILNYNRANWFIIPPWAIFSILLTPYLLPCPPNSKWQVSLPRSSFSLAIAFYMHGIALCYTFPHLSTCFIYFYFIFYID